MKIFTTKETAAILRITEDYLRKLLREGKIRAYKEGNRGGFRILESDIETYIERKLANET